MALSLSPQPFKQTTHTLSLSNTSMVPQPYSIPRQLTVKVESGRHDYETSLPISQTKLPSILHGSDSGDDIHHHHASPQAPLVGTLSNGEDPLVPEVDEPPTEKTTDLTMKQLQAKAQAAMKNRPATATGWTPQSLFDAPPPKAKKARFHDVFITTKPPPHRKPNSRRTRAKPVRGASNAQVLSLVDALARTFNANRHSEGPFSRSPRGTAAQAYYVETGIEDEQLLPNTRLTRAPLKRRYRDTRASEANSEDPTTFLQGVPRSERPVKRLKPIQYESNPALVDAALGTIEAPIGWDAELGLIVNDEDFLSGTLTAHIPSANGVGVVSESDHPFDSVSPLTPAGKEQRALTWGRPTGKVPVLVPYLSRRAGFRQRLDAFFGEDVTVRTDRVARPRPVDLDFIALYDEREGQLNSSASSSPASAVEDEGTSVITNNHITSQSSNTSANAGQLYEVNPLTTPTLADDSGELIGSWITALQRLIKGKVRVKEQDLETLSIILAEIESVNDSLDNSISMTSELRESVKQLSELYEIPFGDRNRLRERAESILRTWPSDGEAETS